MFLFYFDLSISIRKYHQPQVVSLHKTFVKPSLLSSPSVAIRQSQGNSDRSTSFGEPCPPSETDLTDFCNVVNYLLKLRNILRQIYKEVSKTNALTKKIVPCFQTQLCILSSFISLVLFSISNSSSQIQKGV